MRGDATTANTAEKLRRACMLPSHRCDAQHGTPTPTVALNMVEKPAHWVIGTRYCCEEMANDVLCWHIISLHVREITPYSALQRGARHSVMLNWFSNNMLCWHIVFLTVHEDMPYGALRCQACGARHL